MLLQEEEGRKEPCRRGALAVWQGDSSYRESQLQRPPLASRTLPHLLWTPHRPPSFPKLDTRSAVRPEGPMHTRPAV